MCPSPVESSLHTPLAPAKKKKRRLWKVMGYSLLVVALIYGIGVGATIAYFNLAYDLPIFINGASMYPYLNGDAERQEGDHYVPYSYLTGNSQAGDKVDFGYARSRDKINILQEVKRYDVVTTYYPSDYQTNFDGTLRRDNSGKLMLLPGAAPKIKRVLGMPGEHFTYTVYSGQESETANPIWGQISVSKEGKQETLKPLFKMANYKISGSYAYPSLSYDWAQTSSNFELDLKEDEYVVAGDNRGYSSDGLSKRFAITEEMIQGKVYFIVGKATMKATAEGNRIDSDYGFVFHPWTYRRIG